MRPTATQRTPQAKGTLKMKASETTPPDDSIHGVVKAQRKNPP
jgi:hypothetical protein